MKAIAKVKQQRRIKNIPILAHGFRFSGIMRSGIATPDNSNRKVRNRIQRNNRRMNRTSS